MPSSGKRFLANHVQASIARSAQPKLGPPSGQQANIGTRPVAAQARIAVSQNSRIIPPPIPSRPGTSSSTPGSVTPHSGPHALQQVAIQQTPGGLVGGAVLGGLAGLAVGITGLWVAAPAVIVGVLGHYGSEYYYSRQHYQQAISGLMTGDELIVTRGKATAEQLDIIFKGIDWLSQLAKFSLISCKFPSQWSTAKFASLTRLRHFEINNPVSGDPSIPVDNLSGLTRVASLREVKLWRCPFVMDCFDNIALMRQITTLDLSRSLAIEKFPNEKRGPAVRALLSLIKAGRLQTLVLDYCSGLYKEDVEQLSAAADKNYCELRANINFRG
jgi:hypothetical protein